MSIPSTPPQLFGASYTSRPRRRGRLWRSDSSNFSPIPSMSRASVHSKESAKLSDFLTLSVHSKRNSNSTSMRTRRSISTKRPPNSTPKTFGYSKPKNLKEWQRFFSKNFSEYSQKIKTSRTIFVDPQTTPKEMLDQYVAQENRALGNTDPFKPYTCHSSFELKKIPKHFKEKSLPFTANEVAIIPTDKATHERERHYKISNHKGNILILREDTYTPIDTFFNDFCMALSSTRSHPSMEIVDALNATLSKTRLS